MNADAPENWSAPWRQVPGEVAALALTLFKARRRIAPMPNWPQGGGTPVLVLPGFGQSGATTAQLRAQLIAQGFNAQDWDEGRNMGSRKGMSARLLERVKALHAEAGQTVGLVGWSLGGIIARELARKAPEHVLRVISLGSPIAGAQATTIQPLFGLLNPGPPAAHDPLRYQPPPVPCTAIYTRKDGIAHWRATREPNAPNTENIEVDGHHLDLGFNPRVHFAICHRLSPQTRDHAFQPPEI